MARSRNIKPGFYKNEDLADCSVWARFIFPGLWMMADKEGRLEDRPKRIKGELLPYDAQEVEPLLCELVARGFILRYKVDGACFIQITKFKVHQSPHYSEKDSVIKPPKLREPLPVKARAKPGAAVASSGGRNPLNPDSLIPDSLTSDSLKPEPLSPQPPMGALPPGFAAFWKTWPAHAHKQAQGKCLQAWQHAQAEPEAAAVLAHVAFLKRDAWRKNNGRFVPTPLHYLRQRRWEGAATADTDEPSTGDGGAGAVGGSDVDNSTVLLPGAI